MSPLTQAALTAAALYAGTRAWKVGRRLLGYTSPSETVSLALMLSGLVTLIFCSVVSLIAGEMAELGAWAVPVGCAVLSLAIALSRAHEDDWSGY